MAPELLNKTKRNSPETDVYSFGIVLFEVYSREIPYRAMDFNQVLEKVKDPSIDLRPVMPKTCPSNMKMLAERCWARDASTRPTFVNLDDTIGNATVFELEPVQRSSTLVSLQSQRNLLEKGIDHETFPSHVANRIRNRERVEPEEFQNVTILSASICHFQRLSADLNDDEIAYMLETLYSKFDALAKKHGCLRIATNGNNYMASAGLEKHQDPDDHATRVCHLAKALVNAARAVPLELEGEGGSAEKKKIFLSVKVGVHSGPIIGTVVDPQNPRYSLVGETTNTVARLESHAPRERIQCSETVRDLALPKDSTLVFTPGSQLTIKGRRNAMQTYWLDSRSGVASFERTNLRKQFEDLEV